MKVKVELTEEVAQEAILENIKWHINNFKKTLSIIKENKQGSGYESWDYETDKKAVKKIIKSLEVVFNYYGGNLNN